MHTDGLAVYSDCVTGRGHTHTLLQHMHCPFVWARHFAWASLNGRTNVLAVCNWRAHWFVGRGVCICMHCLVSCGRCSLLVNTVLHEAPTCLQWRPGHSTALNTPLHCSGCPSIAERGSRPGTTHAQRGIGRVTDTSNTSSSRPAWATASCRAPLLQQHAPTLDYGKSRRQEYSYTISLQECSTAA